MKNMKSKKAWLFAAFLIVLAWCGRDGVRSAMASGIQTFGVVAIGGTGRTSLTNHNVLLGAATSPINFAAPAGTGNCFMDNGASSDPSFQACPSSGGGNPTITISNAGSTGTTTSTLTKLTGAPSTAVITATTDTAGAVGITTAGAGTTGSATITIEGSVSCVFDGATTAGDYVQISSTTAGNCHDVGATYPTSGQILGRILSTNGMAGTYTINLFPSEIRGQSGGGGGISTSSGTYASKPAAGSSGNLYFTTNSSYVLRDNGASLDAFYQGSIVIPPASQTLTLVNQGASTMNTTNGYGYINGVGTGGYNMRAMVMSLPATPYTCVLGFRFTAGQDSSSSFIWDGLVLRESATAKLQIGGQGYHTFGAGGGNCSSATLFGGCANGEFLAISNFTNPTTYGGSDLLGPNPFNWSFSDIWIKITDDGTTRKWFTGPGKDSLDFQIASEAHAGFFTTAPDQFGYGYQTNYGSGVGLTMKAIHLGCP
jgi:hypothetical protein